MSDNAPSDIFDAADDIIFVLSNQNMINGASILLCPNVMDMIAETVEWTRRESRRRLSRLSGRAAARMCHWHVLFSLRSKALPFASRPAHTRKNGRLQTGVPPAAQPPFRPGFGSNVPLARSLLASLEGLAVRLPSVRTNSRTRYT